MIIGRLEGGSLHLDRKARERDLCGGVTTIIGW